MMKTRILLAALCTTTASLMANTPPSVIIQSIAMRPGTTLMDIVYRVDDPDDATVKVRALAFVDGIRSFANVIRPVTFVEGTDANLGDSITANTNHTLTWNIAADWSIDLGQIKFEVLARDTRGLLPLDWLTIPAAGTNPQVTLSSAAPTDSDLKDALFWLYADASEHLTLEDGKLKGTASSGIYEGEILMAGTKLRPTTAPAAAFIYKAMNLSRASGEDKAIAINARSGINDTFLLHASSDPWDEASLGADPTAATTETVSNRWLKHTYADGAITLSDRLTGIMWVYNASTGGQRSWSSANSYSENLGYAGHTDWHLAPIDVLRILFTEQHHFQSIQNYRYWATGPYSSSGIYPFVGLDEGIVSATNLSAWTLPTRFGQ